MSSFYNGMPWMMYLFLMFGSSLLMFVIARMSSLRKKPLLLSIGFFLLGCMGLTLALAKIFNLLDRSWYANGFGMLSIAFLLLGLPIAMTGAIKASKDNPELNKKLINSSIIMLVLFLIAVAIVLIKIFEK